MSDTEQHITEYEPLRVLSLFRKREANAAQLTSEQYERFYHMLCCTICCELLNNPVYLKCSHRFCKSCIQKHIRTNLKKSCPNCRGSLNTKRDLHSDFALQTLINFAFGNPKLLVQNIQVIDNLQAKAFVSSKKQQSLPCLKRLKSQEQGAMQPKKRIKKNKKTYQIAKQQNNSEVIEQLEINNLERILKIKTLASNQTKINYIEIQSQSDENKRYEDKLIKKQFITPKKHTFQIENPKNDICQSHSLLKRQFGPQYIKKALQLTPFQCFIAIKLVRFPLKMFTPQINCKKICLSIKSPLKKIADLIAKKINIKIDRVCLFLNDQTPLLNLNESLLDLNERIWKSLKGFELFQVSETLDILKQWPEHDIQRIIKYSIQI